MPYLYYAIANGRQPGLYRDWPTAQAQVTRFRNAVFKGFDSISEAKYFMRQANAQDFAYFVGEEERRPPAAIKPSPAPIKPSPAPSPAPPPAPPRAVVNLKTEAQEPILSQFSQEWAPPKDVKPGTKDFKEWRARRTKAGSARLQELFFRGTMIDGYRELCRQVGIVNTEHFTVKDCQWALRSKLVNIYDLIDAVECSQQVPVWQAKDWAAFMAYTLRPENCYNLDMAKQCEILSCFLQDFTRFGPGVSDKQVDALRQGRAVTAASWDTAGSERCLDRTVPGDVIIVCGPFCECASTQPSTPEDMRGMSSESGDASDATGDMSPPTSPLVHSLKRERSPEIEIAYREPEAKRTRLAASSTPAPSGISAGQRTLDRYFFRKST